MVDTKYTIVKYLKHKLNEKLKEIFLLLSLEMYYLKTRNEIMNSMKINIKVKKNIKLNYFCKTPIITASAQPAIQV